MYACNNWFNDSMSSMIIIVRKERKISYKVSLFIFFIFSKTCFIKYITRYLFVVSVFFIYLFFFFYIRRPYWTDDSRNAPTRWSKGDWWTSFAGSKTSCPTRPARTSESSSASLVSPKSSRARPAWNFTSSAKTVRACIVFEFRRASTYAVIYAVCVCVCVCVRSKRRIVFFVSCVLADVSYREL